MLNKVFYVVLIFVIIPNCFAETKYIKSLVAKIIESPKHGSKLIIPARRGTEVDELEKKAKWSHVKLKSKNKRGWIPSILLSNRKPMKRTSLLAKKIDLSKNSRKRASTFTSTAAARGLTSKSDDVFKNLGKGNYKALKDMEAMRVKPKDGLKFLIAGLKKKRRK